MHVNLADLRPVREWHAPMVIQGQDLTPGLIDPNADCGLLEKQENGCCQPTLPAKGCPLGPNVSSTEVCSGRRRMGTKEWPLSLDV